MLAVDADPACTALPELARHHQYSSRIFADPFEFALLITFHGITRRSDLNYDFWIQPGIRRTVFAGNYYEKEAFIADSNVGLVMMWDARP